MQEFQQSISSSLEAVSSSWTRFKESVAQTADYTSKQVQEFSNSLSTAVQQQIKTTAHGLGTVAKSADEQREKLQTGTQVIVDTGVAHFQHTEEIVFEQLKENIKWWIYHPTLTYSILGVSTIFVLPFTRRLIFKGTSRFLTSEESRFSAAQVKFKSLIEKTDGQALEGQKLLERVALASEEFQRGKKKLRSSSSELRSLLGRIESSERQLADVQQDLRELPKSKVFELRSKTAEQLAMIRRQKNVLAGKVDDIINKGVW
eukprot:TRINITY_DN2044_c1_g1_i1.p1 TRINITY_DN2044_c1_g1~~TRINITY_DN2044_c1_g1_i1.p1  ORF type:complete len:288 (-),score=27.36 TRINITY_DN2044_c1_g1_i1:567-1346(-)